MTIHAPHATGHDQSGLVYARGAKPPGPGGAAGAATSFVYGNGRLLAGARVQLIFWGGAWLRWPEPTPTVGACTDAVLTILGSDYLTSLGQYAVGGATLAGVTVVADAVGGSPADPPNPFSSNDVWNLVEHLRAAGRIPVSDIGSSAQGLYVVVLPSGVTSSEANVIGEHSYYWFGSPATNVPYAWITQSSLDTFSEVFSHELVEACTDPEGTGWTSATACGAGHGGWCEIADVCENNDARMRGVMVQRYWSNADSQCVVPDDAKVGQDTKTRKDANDSKDHKDVKDRKEGAKDHKDGAKEKDQPKEKDRPKELESPVGPSADPVAQLRELAEQLQAVVDRLSAPGEAQPFIGAEERPAVGDVDGS